MTTVDHATSPTSELHPVKPAIRRPWWSRLMDVLIPGRRAALRRHAEMIELAKKNPPPQRWYDEDFSDLRKPPAS